MYDFQEFLNQALDQIELTSVKNTPEIEEYNIDAEVRDLVAVSRSASGLTQKQLAQRTGISQANISKIENGSYHPSLSTLKRIADALGKRLVVRFENLEV